MTEARILIVDDDRDFAEGLAELLELNDYRVDLAFTGEDGIAEAKTKTYAAILMDIGLPGANGVESLREIRKTRPETRCFLLTGYSADHIADQGIEAGALEILTKPIDPEDLKRRLAAIRDGL
jgi:DNA-binding response OmpR family regulator